MGKELINEALLTVDAVKKSVESAAKAILNEKLNRRVNEEVEKIFEEEEEKKEEKVELELGKEDVKKEEEEEEKKGESFVDVNPMEEFGMKEEEEEKKGEKEEEEEEEKEEEEEEVPSSEELGEVYEMIMKEMQVGPLPKDVTEVEKEAKPKEKDWAEGEAEGKNKTFQVKESKMLKNLLRLHRDTVSESKKKDEIISKLVKEMKDINLFNTKLLYATKILGENVLNVSERKRVLSMFDAAGSPHECKAVYNSFTTALGMNKGKLNESITRKIGGLNKTVLKENATREDSNGDLDRMHRLAGLISDEE